MYHFPLGPTMRSPSQPAIPCRRSAAPKNVDAPPCAHGGKSTRNAATRAVKPAFWDEATRALGRRDRVLRRLIRAHPGVHLKRRSDAFTSLARAIVGQQISVKAAESIWRRFAATVATVATPAGAPRVDPRAVATRELPALRACGLSSRKAEYLRDLSAHFASGRLDPERWTRLDDEALIEALVAVKGIGRWTAEMFLIFHELRADVLPVDDIGLQKAIALHYNGGKRPTPAAMRELALGWRPYRSVATWYLWRSLDPIPVEY
jgi:DNA-3-methyladenine glycosylase II